MQDAKRIQEHLDKLYAELGELRRFVIIHSAVRRSGNRKAWQDLMSASEQVSALWRGPNAVEEIRAQREK